jgi:hypothetical protein
MVTASPISGFDALILLDSSSPRVQVLRSSVTAQPPCFSFSRERDALQQIEIPLEAISEGDSLLSWND